MELTIEQIAIRDAAGKFAATELFPNAAAFDETSSFPNAIVTTMADLGYMGMFIPECWGGTGGNHMMNAIVMEEISSACGGISTMMHVHNSTSLAISTLGTESQKVRFLPKMALGHCIGAFCMTEPGAGSDTAMIKTRATKFEGGWEINGTKQYITNGRRAGVAIVAAVTDPLAGRSGIALFLVPTETPGFEVGRVEKKMGQKCSDTTEIFLRNCRIPDENLLGSIDKGYLEAMSLLGAGRVSVAAQAVGMARGAYEQSLKYSKERTAFGKTIIKHQAIAFRLAEMLIDIEVARQYVFHVAGRLDLAIPSVAEASVAKAFASEMAEKVCSQAVSTFGGYGYMTGATVERIYRDVRVCQIYEGTRDIQRLIISSALLRS